MARMTPSDSPRGGRPARRRGDGGAVLALAGQSTARSQVDGAAIAVLGALLAFALFLASHPPSRHRACRSSPDGRRQMTAVRVSEAITMDGLLTNPSWSAAAPATGFIQADPREGEPATEDTEVRVVFDTTPSTSAPGAATAEPSGIVVNEIRKDFCRPRAGHLRGAARHVCRPPQRLRLLHQRGRRQGRHADCQRGTRRQHQLGRGVVGRMRARTAEGWTAEFRIPFKTLRFEGGDAHDWGINFARRIRRKNEVSYWSPVSRAFSIYRASSEGDLDRPASPAAGPQHPHQAVSARRRGARRRRERFRSRLRAPAWTSRPGITPSLTLDVDHQPGLRAGRGRRAAGQPHPVQPLLPGKARVLPRELRHLLLRRHPAQHTQVASASARPKKTCSCSSAAASA